MAKDKTATADEDNIGPGMGTLRPPEGWAMRDPSDVRFAGLKETREPFKGVRRE